LLRIRAGKHFSMDKVDYDVLEKRRYRSDGIR
jgi:hypothetical protein